MCHSATVWLMLGAVALSQAPAFGQTAALDWRRVGNSSLELRLPGAASGPVARVWHSPDGSALFARTADGRTYTTSDYENWAVSAEPPPAGAAEAGERSPEARAVIRGASLRTGRVYAAGSQAWRSDDGGLHWENLTGYAAKSILGGALSDLAVSPADPDDIVVAGATGLWRSLDGGLTWTGLNAGLPNLPLRRILAVPEGSQPMRIETEAGEAEWMGGLAGWVPAEPVRSAAERARRRSLSQTLGAEITAAVSLGDTIYAGSADGRLWASTSAGRTWNRFPVPDGGRVEAIHADVREPMIAVAAIAAGQRGRVLRTSNGGVFWDDLSEGAALGPVHGVAADLATGAVYAATASGLYLSYGGGGWTPLTAGVPSAPALDVKLNSAGHQMYVAFLGYGVYAATAPHRIRDPKLVSAGDLGARAAAPGALLTMIGRKVEGARTGERALPVLAGSQVQVPFDITGTRVAILLESAAGSSTHTLPLQAAAPAILVDAEGTPLITDADSGLLLNASTPVRPGSRLQVFATGLGRVRPEWTAGIPAPLQNPPQVIAPVRAFLERQPLRVTRATLAPGYVGLYLLEVELPSILNAGTAELYVEVDAAASNKVKLYIEP